MIIVLDLSTHSRDKTEITRMRNQWLLMLKKER